MSTEGAVEVPAAGVTKREYCEDSAIAAAENNQSQTEHLDTPDMYKDNTSPDYFSFEDKCVEVLKVENVIKLNASSST